MKKTSALCCKSILLGFITIAFAICAAPVSGQTTQPKRFVVLSRYSESVKSAESLFEKKYGAGLIEVETGESEIALDKLAKADVIVFHYLNGGVFEKYAATVPLKNLRAQLNIDEKSPVRVILALSFGFSKQDDVEELERYGVPVINLMTTRMSEAEWIASIKGIEPERLPNQLNAPERAGANEPTMITTTEKVEGSEATRTLPVAERVASAVKRARRRKSRFGFRHGNQTGALRQSKFQFVRFPRQRRAARPNL